MLAVKEQQQADDKFKNFITVAHRKGRIVPPPGPERKEVVKYDELCYLTLYKEEAITEMLKRQELALVNHPLRCQKNVSGPLRAKIINWLFKLVG